MGFSRNQKAPKSCMVWMAVSMFFMSYLAVLIFIDSLTLANTGNKSPANIAMMAITTSSSINVNPAPLFGAAPLPFPILRI